MIQPWNGQWKTRRLAWLVLGLLAIGSILFAGASTAGAHASLTKTEPAAGARMDASPDAVRIVFNERLDTGGAKLFVLDELSKQVAGGRDPERIEQGKGLQIPLPKLGEGHYTVSYSVISEDGHPVSGAYVFTVGNPAPLPNASQLDPHKQVGHSSHDHSGTALTDRLFLLYTARIVYYAALLVFAGLLLWSIQRSPSETLKQARDKAIDAAGKFMLLAALAYVFISMMDLMRGEPVSAWLDILKDTTTGRLYAATLLLGFAAPLVGGLGLTARLFWTAVMLFVEAWSGHASVFKPVIYTVGLDYVHLLAASLWAGGLILLYVVWRKERPEAGRFALVFSRWALLSFLVLWVTGILSTLDFLPSFAYLFYTAWGKWLIAKAALSLVVAIAAFLIRRRLARGDLPPNGLLKADVGLLAAIVLTVGVLTYQTPLPANEPLHYHEMGTEMHVTLRVTPNAPGDNSYILKVWLPENLGDPKQVQLRLLPSGREDVGFIDVPIQPFEDDEMDGFPDYTKFAFKAEGPYMPFAGQWKAQIRVTDSKGTELVRETTFRIY